MTCAWNPPGHEPVIAYTALAPPEGLGLGLVVEGDGVVAEGDGVVAEGEVVEGDGDVVEAGGVVGDGVGLPVEPLAFQ